MKNTLTEKEEATIRNKVVDRTLSVRLVAFVQFWSVIISISGGLLYHFSHADYKRLMLATICICTFLFVSFGFIYYLILSKAIKHYEELKQEDRIQFYKEYKEMDRL